MDDPLMERLARVRAYSASARRRAGMYSELASMDGREAARSLRAARKAPAPGGKLQKVGFLMLWIPEPTGVTCAVGGPMILAGRYLDRKYNGATVSDVGRAARGVAADLRGVRESMG